MTEAVSLIHPLLRAARPDRFVLVCPPEPLFQRFQPAVLFVRVSPAFSAHHQCTPSCRLCFRPSGRGCKDECWFSRDSDEPRVGKECVSTCRSWWLTEH